MNPGAARPIVEVEDLMKFFGSFVAVNHVSFHVEPGMIFGLLGPNGAGKSTVIRILCGLLQPSSGIARIAGVDVGKNPEAVRRQIGYMSQRFSLYDDLLVEENLEFFSGIYGIPKKRRKERKEAVMETVGLTPHRKTFTHELPGGWRQRLALACAIVHDPPLLFLDEPTSGVDPVARRTFWDLIYQLADAGRAVLVTTHYMDEAEYCDRLALMHRGSVVAHGDPLQLKTMLGRHGVLQVDTGDSAGTMEALDREPYVVDMAIAGRGLRVIVRELESSAGRIREALSRNQLSISRIERAEPSIGDIFEVLVDSGEQDGKVDAA